MRNIISILALALLCACASPAADPAPRPPAGQSIPMSDLFGSGGRLQGEQLERALAQAAAHPLGSNDNPVRADMPPGQRAYLSRLRCANGQPPVFSRDGNVGPGPYGSIVDRYSVTCPGSEPARSTIFMDMYFPGYREAEPVAGFTIAP